MKPQDHNLGKNTSDANSIDIKNVMKAFSANIRFTSMRGHVIWILMLIINSAHAAPDFGTKCSSFYTASEGKNEAFMFLAGAYHDGALGWTAGGGLTANCPVSSEEVFYKGYIFQVTAAQCVRPSDINGDGCVAYKGPAPIDLVFFNGVWNDFVSANNSKNRVQAEFPGPYKDAPVTSHLFYNPTTCKGGVGKIFCLGDIAQTFAQRSDALDGVLRDRWGTFWEIMGALNNNRGSYTLSIGEQLGAYYSAWLELIDSVTNQIINKLVATLSTLAGAPPTSAEVSEHANRLLAMAKSHHSFLLLSHSQGNLYQRAVYESYINLSGNDPAQYLGLTGRSGMPLYGIAPPANVYYNKVLVDIDLVINGLRILGPNSVPPADMSISTSTSDMSGHQLEATYLDRNRPAYSRIKADVTASLNALLN